VRGWLTRAEATLFQDPAGDIKNPDVSSPRVRASFFVDCLIEPVVVKVRARLLALERKRNGIKIMVRTGTSAFQPSAFPSDRPFG